MQAVPYFGFIYVVSLLVHPTTVEQRLPSAPTSSTLAKIEAEGFTPQAFTSHKSEAKVSSSEVGDLDVHTVGLG